MEHTCRDFGKIWEWANRYNTSGFVIESWPGLDPVAELRVGNLGHEGDNQEEHAEHVHGGHASH